MGSIADLKRDLSMALQDCISKQMLPGENIIISLPGSFGEGLVVTDRRAIVIRERDSGLNAGCGVYAYQLGQVNGAMAISSGAGGYIELRLTEPVSDPDSARVYFPSYDADKFKSAADYLSDAAQQSPEPTAASAPASTAPPATGEQGACPKCLAKVDPDSAFCRQCGNQLRAICAHCGDTTALGSKYCEKCGYEMLEFPSGCPKCGGRIRRWMTFCPDCGSLLHPSCMACGAQIVPTWKYCAACGRLLGSDRLDPRSAGSSLRRLQQLRETQEAQQRESEPESQPAPEPQQVAPKPAPAASTGPMTAEAHNSLGRELFENEDLEGAIREFEAAVRIDPLNASYHCNLAVAYDECDRDNAALAEYEKTLELDPNDLTALLSLGYMYSEKEQYDEAQRVWGKILKIAPDSAEAQEVQENLRHQGEL